VYFEAGQVHQPADDHPAAETGTVSVQLEKNIIVVHALTKQTADELATGKMSALVPDSLEADQ
jgi:hypothetical protein